MSSKYINTPVIFAAEELAASGTASKVVDLNDFKPEQPRIGLQVLVAGTGAIKVEGFVSNDGVTYTEMTDGDIATGVTVGTTFYEITPELCRFMKFTITETGAENAATVTMTGAIQ